MAKDAEIIACHNEQRLNTAEKGSVARNWAQIEFLAEMWNIQKNIFIKNNFGINRLLFQILGTRITVKLYKITCPGEFL